jgi:ubiquinone/menaquinone biosynthesis C-methylase UbiE
VALRAIGEKWYKRALRYSFDAGAAAYTWATAQEVWHGSIAEMASHLPADPGPRVLDLGTGPGVSILAMHEARPDARYLGLDIASAMLDTARQRLEAGRVPACLVLADGARLPLRDGSLDAVTGHSFLYLLEDAETMLRETRRVLRPGGRAIFMEPRQGAVAWGNLLRNHASNVPYLVSMAGWTLLSRLEGRYSPARFAREAAAAGLTYERAQPVLYGRGLLCIASRPEKEDEDLREMGL